jgi:N-methylhydantoinase B
VQSTEVLETRFPLRLEWSALATDSGGDGRQRGGLSMQRGIRLLAPVATYSVLADGAVLPAFGILGGGSGIPVGSHVIRGGRDVQFPTPGKVGGFRLLKDDVLVLQSAGGGGYGDPLERAVDRVLSDRREGYVSPDRSRERYGVVVANGGEVDAAATAALRRDLAARRLWLTVVATEERLYLRGGVSMRRICPLSPADAAREGFNDGAIVELLGPGGAPLRAWVVVDRAVEAGTVPLDPLGRRVLGVDAGAPLYVRPL